VKTKEETTFTSEQQDDLRGLLKSLRAYFKDSSDLFKESEVLVGPIFASIIVPIGEEPKKGDDKATNARSELIGNIRKVTTEFGKELSSKGSPLFFYTEDLAEDFIIRFNLAPNDIISAEKTIARTIQILKERHAYEKIPSVAQL
jgi:hypothetical protein